MDCYKDENEIKIVDLTISNLKHIAFYPQSCFHHICKEDLTSLVLGSKIIDESISNVNGKKQIGEKT